MLRKLIFAAAFLVSGPAFAAYCPGAGPQPYCPVQAGAAGCTVQCQCTGDQCQWITIINQWR